MIHECLITVSSGVSVDRQKLVRPDLCDGFTGKTHRCFTDSILTQTHVNRIVTPTTCKLFRELETLHFKIPKV